VVFVAQLWVSILQTLRQDSIKIAVVVLHSLASVGGEVGIEVWTKRCAGHSVAAVTSTLWTAGAKEAEAGASVVYWSRSAVLIDASLCGMAVAVAVMNGSPTPVCRHESLGQEHGT
jgi:hypothetical protein